MPGPDNITEAVELRYKYKYSIAATGRWEHEDVLEWVLYHKSLGFDHIYFFSNDDDPMPTFKALTPFLFGSDPFVTFTHVPKPSPESIQHYFMYHYFMKNFKDQTEWFAMIDVDEFFVFKGVDNVHTFMREFENDYDAVYFNWLIFGHSGKVERDHESLLLSHTQRERNVNVHTKMITRSSKIDADAILAAYLKGGKAIWWHFWSQYEISDFRQVNVLHHKMDEYGVGFPDKALEYVKQPNVSRLMIEKSYLVHYQFRSESDLLRRIERGGTATNAIWKREIDNGTYLKMFNGRNDVWDVYQASYWLKNAGCSYDITLKTESKPALTNLALRKPNIQSSWHKPTPEDPKRSFSQGHANNGIRNATYGFRTLQEEHAWWIVDLLGNAEISQIHIYNDVSSPEAQAKANALVLEISENRQDWVEIYRIAKDDFEGWQKTQPLVVKLEPKCDARFLRVSSAKPTELQLDEIEIYGTMTSAT
jgi:hypothetical protein